MADNPRPEDGEPSDALSAEDAMKRIRAAAKQTGAAAHPEATTSQPTSQPENAGGEITPEEAMRRIRAASGAMRPVDSPTPQFIAEHTLTAEETLSHLALKYYGHATPPYWRLIYEANKELIGKNPNRVRPGMVIKIPELPDGMK